MDGARFDDVTRRLAAARSRRGFLAALAGGVVGIVGPASAGEAACPPDQVYRRRIGCVCKATGRPPIREDGCPCPRGLTRCANGCVDLATDDANCGACEASCPVGEHVAGVACRDGSCQITCDDGFANCDDRAATGCETPLGTTDDCASCGNACAAPTPACLSGVGCVACHTPDDCPPSSSSCLANTCIDNVCGTEPANESGSCGTDQICCGGGCFAGDCCVDADCGGTGETCGGGGVERMCGCTPTFTPADCDSDTCGAFPDGCGETVACGCTAPEICGGGGVEGECGCTPDCTGKCGGVSDGCGGACEVCCPLQAGCTGSDQCCEGICRGKCCSELGGICQTDNDCCPRSLFTECGSANRCCLSSGEFCDTVVLDHCCSGVCQPLTEGGSLGECL